MFIIAATGAFGATAYTWDTSVAAGSWNTATNWIPNGVPGSVPGDTATTEIYTRSIVGSVRCV